MAGSKTKGPFPNAIELYPKVRQSDLSSFDDCALSALWSIKYGKGWGTHPQNRGTIAHATIAECLRTMRAGGHRSIQVSEALEVLYEQLLQEAVADEDVVRVPLKQLSELRMAIIKWAADNTFTTSNIVGIEDRLDAEVTYDTPAGPQTRILTGQPDVLIADPPDGAIILDWKDTWALPPESAEDERVISQGGYFQQRFYGYLVLKNFPAVQSVTLREFYIRKTKSREATLHRSKLEDVERELAVLVKQFDRALESGIDRRSSKLWHPSPGHHCGWCLKPGDCPIEREARGEGAITNENEAKRYAAEYKVADRVRKHRRDALRTWLDNRSGYVELKKSKGRRGLGFIEKIVTPRPSAEEIERAEKQGIPPKDLFRPQLRTEFREFTPDDSDRGVEAAEDLGEPDTELIAAAKSSAKRAQRPKVRT